ncbi:MAG TPA: DUF4199 domain-containing protein [Microscillaceae bacterium]|nr:DUF4199 domain-containing protein [Microscillaceae bacterium]
MMARNILIYGLIGGAVMTILHFATIPLWDKDNNYDLGEVFGYASMILSLLAVYLGIKHYRDKYNNGSISFQQGFKVGLSISTVAGMLFSFYVYFFYTKIDPEFMTKYQQHFIEKIEKSKATAEEKAKQISELKATFADPLYNNWAFQSFIMFATVFLIGVVVTLLSSGILKKKTASEQKEAATTDAPIT